LDFIRLHDHTSAYLRRVFTDLPQPPPLEDIEALLPWNITATDSVAAGSVLVKPDMTF